jgi:hypothetical protein
MTEEEVESLKVAIEAATESGDETSLEAFTEMLGRGRPLTEKQRGWVDRVAGVEVTEYAPTYENLVSSGKVVRGAEVETPLVLRNLPLKPPGRR